MKTIRRLFSQLAAAIRRAPPRRLLGAGIAMLVLVLVLVLVFAGGMILGSANRDSERSLFRLVDRYADRLKLRMSTHSVVTPAEAGEIKISTIFVPIVGKTVKLPERKRGGTGGGLTLAEGHVVSLNHEGGIYFVTPERKVVKARIELPDNGYAAYVAANKAKRFAGVKFDEFHFRYIDIAYLKHGGRRGFAVSYTFFEPDNTCFRNQLAVAYFDGDLSDPASLRIPAGAWRRLYQSEPCLPLRRKHDGIAGNLAGGRILVDSDRGRLLFTNGEYGWGGDTIAAPSGVPLPQDPKAHYGKVISIDLESGAYTIVAGGLRNMQGIVFDKEGRLWTIEHGPRGGDELNLIEPGNNYGWPHVSYGTAYSGLPLPYVQSVGWHEGFVRPKYSWLPSIAPSSLTTIDGFHQAWDGDLMAGTLKTHKLVRIRVAEGRVIFTEDIKIGQGRRIRYVMQHTDGTLVVLTDDHEVIFFSPVKGGIGAEFVTRFIDTDLKASDTVREATAKAITKCTECHSLEKGENANSPSLAEVFEQRVASTSFQGYTPALRGASGDRWTRKRLDAYLADPQAVYPGTAMPDPQLGDPATRKAVVDVLQALVKTQ